MKIPITKRLLCCASLVKNGARVADVGCDHGYLGIHLLQHGVASFVAAMDLRPDPLECARKNANRFGLADQMFFAVCDGLSALKPGEVDTVVCAGMGGDTMIHILENCEWLCQEKPTLILQPQSSGNDLRRWLGEHGFSIQNELLVQESGFLYSVIEACAGETITFSPGKQYVSDAVLRCEPELVQCYLTRIQNGIQRAVDGISKAKSEGERARLHYYQTALREVQEMGEQYEKCQADL